MIGSLIISGLGLLLTNPSRKTKRRRKSRRKNPGLSAGRTLADYAAEVVSALAFRNAYPRIPRDAMPYVRDAWAAGWPPPEAADDIVNGYYKAHYANNPWTHGTLGLGDTRAAKGLAAAHRSRDAEQDRHRYLRDAVELAKAHAPLREIVALTHAAGRIRKLTAAEIERVVKARGIGGRSNPRKRRGRRNPPRDPKYLGAFTLPTHPTKSGAVEGDTAAVESPHKPGVWEVWLFDLDDPHIGRAWNWVGEERSRGAAETRAKQILDLFS